MEMLLDKLFGLLREHQRVADSQHAAGGVGDERGALDADGLEQHMRVVGQLLERVLIVLGLARFTEADLVVGDDAVTGASQQFDGRNSRNAAKVLAVQEDNSASVGGDARNKLPFYLMDNDRGITKGNDIYLDQALMTIQKLTELL